MLSLLQAGCQAERAVTITLGGDVILGREGQPIFAKDPWGGLAPNVGQDWFFVNLESPLGRTTESRGSSNGYNLCAPSESAEILQLAGVDLVSTANNHREDCFEMVNPSQVAGVTQVLEGQPVVLESPGSTIAILAADAVSKPLDMPALLASVAEIEPKTDILIVSLHWGVEYAGQPTDLQLEQAQQLADAGVDVLWGHHPHVLQPIEWVRSTDGTHRMLAIYSLGNLLTDQMMTLETRRSALIEIQFEAGEISQLSFQPIALNQKDGELSLDYPGEDEINHISKRLGWEELLESFR